MALQELHGQDGTYGHVCISDYITDEAKWRLMCGPEAALGPWRPSSATNEVGERGQRW